jgi:hypothetical protein
VVPNAIAISSSKIASGRRSTPKNDPHMAEAVPVLVGVNRNRGFAGCSSGKPILRPRE